MMSPENESKFFEMTSEFTYLPQFLKKRSFLERRCQDDDVNLFLLESAILLEKYGAFFSCGSSSIGFRTYRMWADDSGDNSSNAPPTVDTYQNHSLCATATGRAIHLEEYSSSLSTIRALKVWRDLVGFMLYSLWEEAERLTVC